MRIIGGTHRGRALLSPVDLSIRPTSDRTREALFNLLLHGHFDESPVMDQTVMDVCCGSGALGLEALSRGAAHAIFIDHSREAISLAQANAEKLGEFSRCRFHQTDAAKLPRAPQPVALVMVDAPYRSGLIHTTYTSLQAQGWLHTGTIIACEQDQKEATPELSGCTLLTERAYGKAKLMLFRVD